MDDRFKSAMDAITPDENMIERIIKSEVALFRRALTLLCWGLVFTSFVINIPAIESQLYATWIGCLLSTLGLWMLRTENPRMTVAFRSGALLLILRSVSYWLDVFPASNRLLSDVLPLCIAIALHILMLTMIYNLFSGLRDIALRFENEELASRLMRCFWLYISLYILIFACLLIPFLIYPLILYTLLVLIKLPATVGKLKQYVPLGRRETTVKAINKRVLLAVGLYLAVTVGGELGCLYYVNAPNPESQIYINAPSAKSLEIREKLLDLGMPDYILRDLPDDEVREYEGIYNATSQIMGSNEATNRDGGKLEIYAFIGIMPEGKVRTLFYYRWLELPGHKYVDLLSIAMPMNLFAKYADSKEMGLALYDRDGKTYSQTLLNDGELLGQSNISTGGMSGFSHSGFLTQIQFRLYPKYENQRGYAAVNMIAAHPSEPMAFNSWAAYVHQESLWNRPYFNALNQTAGNGYSHIKNSAFNTEAFWSEGFYTVTDYEPEGWVWPE